jgi:hypothetical protein
MRNMNLPSILALSPHIPFFLLPSPVVSVQDASRLVFASVQGARPRRKVAIPIVDDMTWSAFVAVLRSKLHLDHVGAVHLVNTGVQVTSLDQLEDIDELIVDPNPTTSQSNPNAEPATNPSSSSSDHPSSRSSVPLSSPSARVGPLGPSASTRPVPSLLGLDRWALLTTQSVLVAVVVIRWMRQRYETNIMRGTATKDQSTRAVPHRGVCGCAESGRLLGSLVGLGTRVSATWSLWCPRRRHWVRGACDVRGGDRRRARTRCGWQSSS